MLHKPSFKVKVTMYLHKVGKKKREGKQINGQKEPKQNRKTIAITTTTKHKQNNRKRTMKTTKEKKTHTCKTKREKKLPSQSHPFFQRIFHM